MTPKTHSRREQILRLFEADPRRIADCVVGLEEQLETARKERSDAAQVAARAMDRSERLEEQLEAYDAALRRIADKQQIALSIIRDNGFVFDDIGKEPGNWKHLAFTLYNEICEIDVWARNTLGIEIGEDATSIPASEPKP